VRSFFNQATSPVHITEGREQGEDHEGSVSQEEEENS